MNLDRRIVMNAYLKIDPSRVGEIFKVYITEEGKKRLTVVFEFGTIVEAGVEDFEIAAVSN